MKYLRMMILVLLASSFSSYPAWADDAASKDQELFNQGKILLFDKKWEEARNIFQRVLREYPKSTLVGQASYFTGRCLQMQGKEVEALQAYEQFLQKYPNELYLPSEARNAVLDLAATLVEKGDTTYSDRITAGLSSQQKDARYFAAIRSSYLGDPKIKEMSIRVLREILEKEKERDLVDRAKIALLRLDPNALSKPPGASDRKKGEEREEARMFHIRITEDGKTEPTVELNLPLGFAELAVMALTQSKKDEMRRNGFDVDKFWDSFKRLGPTNILTFRDGKDLVKIWIE